MDKVKFSWSDNKIETLIKLVEVNEVIYNVAIKEYRNSNKKNLIFGMIATQLGTTG